MKFSASDYIENTSKQNEFAPSFFSETTKLDYPNDAKLINISHIKKFMANEPLGMLRGKYLSFAKVQRVILYFQ